MKIEEFINANWDKCTMECRQDEEIRIGLPYPYSIPATEKFDCMYYWDTYFANLGLLRSGRAIMAKCNVDNMLYLVNKFGFMPNGNRWVFLSRSQPPFLSLMVKDIYEYYKDTVWLKGAYELLKREYDFWITKRGTSCGLCGYGCDLGPDMYNNYAVCYEERVGVRPEGKSDEEIAKHAIATAESGWDMNPRWGFEAYNYVQVDLNCLLYMLEKNMSEFAKILKIDEVNLWSEREDKRRELMNKFMTDENGLFFDYNFKENKLSSVFSVASFFPLFAGFADEKQAKAAVSNLCRLEMEYGISTCEKSDNKIQYQWDYPNGWACMQYVTVKGLLNYGYTDEAMRIADKYISSMDKIFEETGNLWEKYNVTDGTLNVVDEYKMPAMMGWTAGVYLALKNIK